MTFSRIDCLKRHFSMCADKRGNPDGVTHLTHAQAHLKVRSRPKKRASATSLSSHRRTCGSDYCASWNATGDPTQAINDHGGFSADSAPTACSSSVIRRDSNGSDDRSYQSQNQIAEAETAEHASPGSIPRFFQDPSSLANPGRSGQLWAIDRSLSQSTGKAYVNHDLREPQSDFPRGAFPSSSHLKGNDQDSIGHDSWTMRDANQRRHRRGAQLSNYLQ